MNVRTVFFGRQRTLFLFFILILAYLFTRFYHLLSLPIFTDEAIYIRWAQIISDHPRSLFISLVDGKQPLFIWAIVFLLKIFHDPLFAGRCAGIFFGLLTLLGIFVFVRVFFQNTRFGLLSMFLYILFPMALVYDRMALYESATSASVMWSMVIFSYFLQKPSSRFVLLLGLSWGIGLLIKTTGFFIIYLSFFLPFLMPPKNKRKIGLFVKYGIFLLLSLGVAVAMYSVLRLSPHFSQLEAKNAVFAYHFSELIPYGAFISWPNNLVKLGNWTVLYFTAAFSLLSFFSFLFLREYKRQILVLWFLFLTQFLLLGLFGRLLNPRYLFSISIFLIPLAAISLEGLLRLSRTVLALRILVVFLLLPVAAIDYGILRNFQEARIPREDLMQYINGWPAGGGMREIMTYLSERSKVRRLFVYTEGIYGSLPTTVSEIYLGKNKNIRLSSYDPTNPDAWKEFTRGDRDYETFIVVNQAQELQREWPVRLIASYRKGSSDVLSSLYILVP
ncbi:MAG: glycosyltransferase family 39 protein [bacterium]|nr:glycosyltransferase family 39 protein [bacterium]